MFSRTFKFKGYDGKDHEETWWFNLSEDELYKLELGNLGGMNGMMNRLLRQERPGELVDIFERLILSAVGERSIDGRKFMKRCKPGQPWGEVAEDFKETPAYAQLFTELVSSGEALAKFLQGAVPEEVAAAMAKAEAEKAKAEQEAAEQPKLEVVEGGVSGENH